MSVEGLTSGEGVFGQGRFADWPSDTLAAQCRMQARDSLDPDFMQFMEAVAVRLAASPATHAGSMREAGLAERLRQLARRQRQYGATNTEKIDTTCDLTIGDLDAAAAALHPVDSRAQGGEK